MTGPEHPSAQLVELSEARREQVMTRWALLRPHVEDGVALATVAREGGVPLRTAQRWLADYRRHGLVGLARRPRSGKGQRSLPEQLVRLIEGMALRRPPLSAATIHRQVLDVAGERGWPTPSYSTVYAIVAGLDPAMVTLAHEGTKRYEEVYDLVYRRQAAGPNEIWQADHTELDLWVITPSGKPARPWLTVIEDDHSRAAAGYAVSLEAPSAINTALALHQAIWRKPDPGWPICGIPSVFYTDHGSDFTSRHLETVTAELKIQLVFSLPGKPRGRGKIERLFDSVNQMCLQALPGYAPRGTPDRAGQAQLTLPELDAAIGRFLTKDYHHRVHSETHQTPAERWSAGGFLPRMPDSLEQLDLLLLTVAKPRKIHPDGVHFQGLRYLDPVLAAYVGEHVTIRYDPRDLAEIRVFHDQGFLCRAICPELAGQTNRAQRNHRRAQRPPPRPPTRPARPRHRRRPAPRRPPPRLQPPRPRPRDHPPAGRTRRAATAAALAQALPRGLNTAMSGSQATHEELAEAIEAAFSPLDEDIREHDEKFQTEQAAARERAEREFVVTKQHRRFAEFCDAVRRDRYIGLCYGPPGVGKTLSARYYSRWDTIGPALDQVRRLEARASTIAGNTRTVFYTPTVHNTPRAIEQDVHQLHHALGWAIDRILNPDRDLNDLVRHRDDHTELIIVDEADRLKNPSLEALRDHHDRTGVGLILIGMPGIERRLARYPQLYSRVGFLHHYQPLSADEQTFVLARRWPELGLDEDSDDFTTNEARAAILRTTNGNFRLTSRLMAQIRRIMEINQIRTLTSEVVDAARESLVIGIM